MKRKILLLDVVLVLGLAVIANAQEKTDSSLPKVLTAETAINLRTISDLQFSSNGERLAFVVTEPPKGDRRARHIWLHEKKSGVIRQLTFSEKDELWPRWSPDGEQLAFLSNRDGEQQIFLLRMTGGEGTEVTKGKRGVRAFTWALDGKRIAFLAPDAKTDAEEKRKTDKDDARVVDKETKHARLWVLTLATGATKALTEPGWEVTDLAWERAEDRIVVSATNEPASDEETHRIYSIGAADGSRRLLLAPHGPFRELQLSPSGNTVSYIGSRVDGPQPHDLMLLNIGSQAARNLTGASLDRDISEHRWTKDRSVLALYADGFRNRLAEFSSEGMLKEAENPPTANVSSFAISPNGEIAFVGHSATTPQEIWMWDQKSQARQVSHINEAWKQISVIAPEIYKYKSFDGLEIEAALLKPAAASASAKLPLIALIHGGPTGAWQDSIEVWGQLLAAHGYAVFYPNIRGSTGYGEKFIEMNRADWGGADFKDVMAGVKDLVDRGIADPKKLGIGGWSYGGYMSEWAVTQTTDFKAAVSGAGLSDLVSEFGTEEHPAYDEWFYGVPFEPEKLANYLNSSPFVHLKNVKAPVLILQGEVDTTDPPGQSAELYRGLKHYGLESELVMYPREPHGLREEKHLVDRLNRILAWYEKYVK